MRPAAQFGLVAGGYAVALLAAYLAVEVNATFSGDHDRSGGMHAFGDALLFLAVFGVAAVPPTGAAFFFLKTRARFWRALSIATLFFVASAGAAYVEHVAAWNSTGQDIGSLLSLLRILLAPLFALAFFTAAFFAPDRTSRFAVLVAAAVEAGVFGGVAFLVLSAPS